MSGMPVPVASAEPVRRMVVAPLTVKVPAASTGTAGLPKVAVASCSVDAAPVVTSEETNVAPAAARLTPKVAPPATLTPAPPVCAVVVRKVPALTVVGPVYVLALAAVSCSVPLPVFVMPPVPAMSGATVVVVPVPMENVRVPAPILIWRRFAPVKFPSVKERFPVVVTSPSRLSTASNAPVPWPTWMRPPLAVMPSAPTLSEEAPEFPAMRMVAVPLRLRPPALFAWPLATEKTLVFPAVSRPVTTRPLFPSTCEPVSLPLTRVSAAIVSFPKVTLP